MDLSRMGEMRLHFLVFVAAVVVLFGQAKQVNAQQNSARQDFLTLCADCHNADAKGNGPLAKNLTKIPPDLTRIRERAGGVFDEKAVYDWILGLKMSDAHGSREMPIWGDWLMDEAVEDSTSLDAARAAEKEIEQRIMAIVEYLKSLQMKE
jgi:mono/diheme cytochrome c family protein